MKLQFQKRNFYSDELRLLRTLKNRIEKGNYSKIKFHSYLIAGLLGAGCTYLVSIIPDSFWTFLIGTVAVFSFSFILFAPYEKYKMTREKKVFLKKLAESIDKGTVSTCLINAKRIAIAEEYEDESDLYIIELETNRILYLWDLNYNLHKKLPCLKFEIYDDDFSGLLGRQVYALSDRIQPLLIDKKAKWNYMGKVGAPSQLATEQKDFDALINEYNHCL